MVKKENETKGNEKGTIGTLSMSDIRGSGVGGVDRVGDVDPVSCSGGGGDRGNSGSATASSESSSIFLPLVGDGGDAPSYTAYSKVVLSSRADMNALSSVSPRAIIFC